MATQMENMRLRQNFRNIWHTDLITSNQNHIRYCCFAFWCAPCVSYMLRKRALYDDMSRYTCCAGYMPCSGRCEESKYPELCLATEGFISYTQQLGCVFSMIGLIVPNNRPLQKASEVLFFLANLVYCTLSISFNWTIVMMKMVDQWMLPVLNKCQLLIRHSLLCMHSHNQHMEKAMVIHMPKNVSLFFLKLFYAWFAFPSTSYMSTPYIFMTVKTGS
ncbi:uncharacterized protein [Phaseolus vulgaris]|uniref:uncharacterized protein isoform X2 n=1 Tax=Phaseolus vulgaris TaxID=3885 RepID=UPI0035CB150B